MDRERVMDTYIGYAAGCGYDLSGLGGAPEIGGVHGGWLGFPRQPTRDLPSNSNSDKTLDKFFCYVPAS
jgi:hypothetical protein